MEGLQKPLGAYLVGIAVVVAVWFIINTFFVNVFEVQDVWYVLDAFMFAGLVLALGFNARRMASEGGPDAGEPVTRRYLEVNLLFYLTAAIMILFMHNWFSLLAHGADNLEGNDPAWIIWAVVDTTLPIALGVTGCRMWCDASPSKSNS